MKKTIRKEIKELSHLISAIVFFTGTISFASYALAQELPIIDTKIITENVDSIAFERFASTIRIQLTTSRPASGTTQAEAPATYWTSTAPENPMEPATLSCCGDGNRGPGESFDNCPQDVDPHMACGEVTGDGQIDGWDLQMIVGRAWRNEQLPSTIGGTAGGGWRADLNGDGVHNAFDIVMMINFLNRGWSAEDALNCDIPPIDAVIV